MASERMSDDYEATLSWLHSACTTRWSMGSPAGCECGYCRAKFHMSRLRAELSTRPLPPTEGEVGDEEVAEVLQALSQPVGEDEHGEVYSEFDERCARVIRRLSASYSAACGERDVRPTPDQVQRGVLLATTDEIASLKAQLSLALVERDRAREALEYVRLELLPAKHTNDLSSSGKRVLIAVENALDRLTPALNAPEGE